MSPEPVTSERVYQRLKADILVGRHPPGVTLRLQEIADLLGVSISPVRDSAQRLIGERLIDPQHGGGFIVPSITADSLRDLYIWHGHLIRQALKSHASASDDMANGDVSIEARQDEISSAAAAAAIFAVIGRRSRNAEHVHAIVAAGDRLAYARLVEPRVIADTMAELELVKKLTVSGPDADLREAIWSYHRRRIRRVPRLIREMREMIHTQDAS